jgi:hypothetical protein
MANAIDLPSTRTTGRPPATAEQTAPRTCGAISPQTRQPCTEKAQRIVEWGDGTKTACCSGCATHYAALAQEHKCPTYVQIH